MSNFDVNTYVDSLEVEEHLNEDYHCLNGQVQSWENM